MRNKLCTVLMLSLREGVKESQGSQSFVRREDEE